MAEKSFFRACVAVFRAFILTFAVKKILLDMILIADSGSTKTDWWLADGGHVVRRAASQGINPFHQDGGVIYGIVDGELLPQLGDDEPRAVFFYGSGCSHEMAPVVVEALRRAFPHAAAIEAHGDLLGAARAVCGPEQGIACILGTGSNSCLYDGTSIKLNTPPLGYILGDEGSGAVLGRNFVNAMFKGGLSAGLSDSFIAESGLTMAEIVRRVYREPMANRFLASLSPFIHRHIADASLRRLVIDNFRSFFRRNVSAYGRADLPVGVVGSVGYYYSAELSEAADAEGFRLGRVVRSPMEGLVAYHASQGR